MGVKGEGQMKTLWRIVDANLNRLTEGLRVIEDLMRFGWEDIRYAEEVKKLRLDMADLFKAFRERLIDSRDAGHDPGLAISQTLAADGRRTTEEIIAANFKRTEEAARSLEEYLKLLHCYQAAKEVEVKRFKLYQLEQAVVRQSWRRKRLRCLDTDIYGITASEYSLGRSNPEVVQMMLDAGIKVIQYREKEKKMAEKYRECVAIRDLTAKYGAKLIVNDDVHLALAVAADGVHLGQDDLPVAKARELVGEGMIVGLSTHSPEQAREAVRQPVDYIGVGPIYRTFTKKDVCDPVGLEYLEYVVNHIDLPFVAIGGIKEHNIGPVIRKGARTVALVTEIVGAENIGKKIKDIRAAIARAKEMVEDVSNPNDSGPGRKDYPADETGCR